MISYIRNPWIRRPVLILAAPFHVFVVLVIGLLGEIEQYVRSIDLDDLHAYVRDEIVEPIATAWRGRTRGR